MTLEEFADETFGGTLTRVEHAVIRILGRGLQKAGFRIVKLRMHTHVEFDVQRGGTWEIVEELG